MLNKTIIALTAAVALGCVPIATDALAAGQPKGHAGGGHTMGGHAMGGTMGGHAMGGHAMGGHAMAGYARGGHGARYGRYYEGGAPIYDSYGGGGYYEGGAPIYDSSGGRATTRAAHRSMIAAVMAPTALATVAQATASPLSAV